MQGYKRQKSEKYAENPYKRWLADTRTGLENYAQEFCDKNRLDVVILPAEKSTHKHKEPGEWREEQRQKKQAQSAVDRLTAPKTLTDRLNPKAIAERDAAAQYVINHAKAAANAITAAAEQKQKDADRAMQTAQAIAKQAEKEKQITRQKLAAADTELIAMWRMAERNAVLLSRLIGDIPEGQRMVDRQRNDRLRGRFRDEPEHQHQKEEKRNVKENAETRGDNIRPIDRATIRRYAENNILFYNPEDFTLPQALAVAVRIREICHNIKIDESSEKSATVADGIAKITMSSIVRHLDCGNIISWECCIQFKKIDTVGGDGGHFGAAAVQVCQRFIDNILI